MRPVLRASQEGDFPHSLHPAVQPPASRDDHGPVGLGELLLQSRLYLRRNRRLIAGSALTGAMICAFWAFSLEERYRATLTLMVDEPLTSPIEALERGQQDVSSLLDSQVYILNSRDILQAVLDRADLHEVEEYSPAPPSLPGRLIGAVKSGIEALLPAAPPAPPVHGDLRPEPYAMHILRRNIDVNRRSDTNVITISAISTSPRRAAEIAQHMGDAYIANRQEAQHRRVRRLAAWLDERVLDLAGKLSAAEDAVAAYRIEHNLISGDPGSTLSEQQLVELNAELIQSRAALSEKRATHTRARRLLEDGGDIQALPQIQDSEIIITLRTRLLDLQLREAELRRMNASDPRLAGTSEERRAVESQLAAEIARTVDMIGHEVETLEAREALVAAALAEAGGRSGADSLVGVKLRELERIASSYQALYERYLSNAGIADEAASLLFNGVEIIERPTIPNKADFPPTRLFIIWGMLFGGALGVVGAVIREAVQRGFVTSAQAEQELAVPVLSVLPAIPRGTAAKNGLDAALSRGSDGASLAEAIRNLRLSLTHGGPASAPVSIQAGRGRSVLLASAGADGGSADLAATLALSAARAGLSVLLIDADPHQRRISREFGLDPAPGLTELLTAGGDGDATIQRDDRLKGVDILPAGQPGTGSTDLLIGERMRDQLARLERSYDLLVVSAPALPGSADTPMLAQMVDAVTMTIRWAVTPRDVAATALARLAHAPLRGVVLTDADPARARSYGETRLGPAPDGGGARPHVSA